MDRSSGTGRRSREMRKYRRNEIIILLLIVLVLAGFFLILYLGKLHKVWNPNETLAEETTIDEDEKNWEDQHIEELIEHAELIAAGYDFDGAIAYLKSDELYKKSLKLLEEAESLGKRKKEMVAWSDVKNITHLSVRPLIYDTTAAFSSMTAEKYNQQYITTEEFKALLEELYERGYVLVSLHDIAYSINYTESLTESETEESTEETGQAVDISVSSTEASTEETMAETASENEDEESAESSTEVNMTVVSETKVDKEKLKNGKIMLPEGKTPLVLSEENVCYTDVMAQEGFASKLIVKKDGTVACEDKDGNVGGFDLIPVLEEFIAEHPDFSYRGARAVIGISGSENVFGYKTSSQYANTTDYDKNRADAETVAEALKRSGYELAFNGYHYTNMGYASMDDETFINEVESWLKEVEPLVGRTDIFIFPNGDDIGDWRYYSGTRYNYLKEQGFVYFLNMNSTERAWNQILNYYMRQGRRMITGKLLYKELNGAENFTDVLDAEDVYDNSHLPM